VLHVQDNELESLPESIGDLTNLTDLRLNDNRLVVSVFLLVGWWSVVRG
jgi:Leucine-rich repeat (LRR) protein